MLKGLLTVVGVVLVVVGVSLGLNDRTIEMGGTNISCGSPWSPRDDGIISVIKGDCEDAMGNIAPVAWGLLVFGAVVLLGVAFLFAAQEGRKPAASA